MKSFGIELHEVPFDSMCETLRGYGVEFDWPEKNRRTPTRSWKAFRRLTPLQKTEISQRLVDPIRDGVIASVQETMTGGEDWKKRLAEIELLLKTERNEYFTYSFKSTREAINFLVGLQEEATDLRGRL